MNVNKKRRNDDLILIADQALNETRALFKNDSPGVIQDSYNGQIAALPVSIAMNGLLPALVIYYQDEQDERKNRSKVNRRAILTVIAKMISKDKDNNLTCENAQALYTGIISLFESKQVESGKKKVESDIKKIKEIDDLIKKIDNSIKAIKTQIIACSIALKQVVRTYQLEKS